jgi:hypothetical protein
MEAFDGAVDETAGKYESSISGGTADQAWTIQHGFDGLNQD